MRIGTAAGDHMLSFTPTPRPYGLKGAQLKCPDAALVPRRSDVSKDGIDGATHIRDVDSATQQNYLQDVSLNQDVPRKERRVPATEENSDYFHIFPRTLTSASRDQNVARSSPDVSEASAVQHRAANLQGPVTRLGDYSLDNRASDAKANPPQTCSKSALDRARTPGSPQVPQRIESYRSLVRTTWHPAYSKYKTLPSQRSKSAESQLRDALIGPPHVDDMINAVELAKYPSGRKEESPVRTLKRRELGSLRLSKFPVNSNSTQTHASNMFSPVRVKSRGSGRYAYELSKVKDFHIPDFRHIPEAAKQANMDFDDILSVRTEQDRPPTRNQGTSTYIRNLRDFYNDRNEAQKNDDRLFESTYNAAVNALKQIDKMTSTTSTVPWGRYQDPSKTVPRRGVVKKSSVYRSCSLPLVMQETMKPGQFICEKTGNANFFHSDTMTEREYCFSNLMRKYRALDRKLSDTTAQRCAKFLGRRMGTLKRVRSLPQVDEIADNGAATDSTPLEPVSCECLVCKAGFYYSPTPRKGGSRLQHKNRDVSGSRDLEIWSDEYRKKWAPKEGKPRCVRGCCPCRF